MIPFTSCMCPVRMPVQRRGRWLVISQKDAESTATKGDDDSFLMGSNDSKDFGQNSASYFYRAWHISRRRAHKAVITPVDSISFLDDTYLGTAQALLSKCNRWSFNTFNLDVSTGGRSLPFLLFHLFQEYGFINYFRLDVVKVWRCFNLMESAYHRHNPYHNSVHATDVTQAMHCFLQENKFADHLTPLEAMSSIIAAVAHDLDHPGITQSFLVATSNHLVDLYSNSSVLENHHWRTAVSCLLESGIFNHLEKDTWLDIQKKIRSLILATDITRQKEFLCRFKGYLSSQSLDMEKSQYRHFALQIALKCADLCNPCRPWSLSQRWSYQVCQEFFRQGSFEWQLNLPLTPTYDCSKSRIPKIQTDFLRHVVMPLFETWDNFLGTRLSNLLLKNLHKNYIQWQQKMDVMDMQQTKIKASNIKSLRLLKEDCNESKLKRTPTTPQHVRIILKDKKLPTQKRKFPHLLSSKCHLQTYCTEELHPLTSLLSLSSTISTVLLRKACILSEAESRLISINVMHPFTVTSSDCQASDDSTCTVNSVISSSSCVKGKSFCTFPKADINSNAQTAPDTSDTNDCCTQSSLKEFKPHEENEHRHCQPSSFLSTLTGLKQQKYRLLDCSKDSEIARCTKPLLSTFQKPFDGKNVKIPNSNSSCPTFYHTSFQNTFTGKGNSTKTSICSTKNVQKIIAPVKITASWCWHIRRSLSAERPQQSGHDFDFLFSTRKGSNSCQTCNKTTGRRGSAPVPSVWNRDNSQTLSVGNPMDDKKRLVGETEVCGPTVRRWSIPLEPISS